MLQQMDLDQKQKKILKNELEDEFGDSEESVEYEEVDVETDENEIVYEKTDLDKKVEGILN